MVPAYLGHSPEKMTGQKRIIAGHGVGVGNLGLRERREGDILVANHNDHQCNK